MYIERETDEWKDGWMEGNACGKSGAKYKIAREMQVLFCALITAHKIDNSEAFWATVEIAKKTLASYANFTEEDWAIFRGDSKKAKRIAPNA